MVPVEVDVECAVGSDMALLPETHAGRMQRPGLKAVALVSALLLVVAAVSAAALWALSSKPTMRKSTSAAGMMGTTATVLTSSNSSQCSSVTFLRIQKTGSTTLGEVIMPAMCRQNQQSCAGGHHLDYSRSTNNSDYSCVITMVRDPVERFMSEFSMALSQERQLMTQDQWDFAPQDVPWLESVATHSNTTESLLEYLHNPNNPSRNRQTLYLLGFKRVGCQPRRKCCGVCSADPGYPAHAYDWDKDHVELLARAKDHIMSLRAFGVTGWYADSLKVLAAAVGWNETATVALADQLHRRPANKGDLLAKLTASSLNPSFLQLQRTAMHNDAVINERSWSESISPELEHEIRRVNSVDDELVAFARQKLYEQHKPLFSAP